MDNENKHAINLMHLDLEVGMEISLDLVLLH